MTAWSSECWILQMLQSGGFEVEKEGTAVIKLSVDKEGSNCGGSFNVKHGQMQRRSQMCIKQEQERLEMWLAKERCGSKVI